MFITNILFKKPKAKDIVVILESLASGHKATAVRERLGDKLEQIRFDPYVQMECVYKEIKKLRSLREKGGK